MTIITDYALAVYNKLQCLRSIAITCPISTTGPMRLYFLAEELQFFVK